MRGATARLAEDQTGYQKGSLIKAWNGDAAVGVVQASQELRQRKCRILHRASDHACRLMDINPEADHIRTGVNEHMAAVTNVHGVQGSCQC